jgi:hypothetical protein
MLVTRTKGGAKGIEAHCPDEKEVEKTFWLSRPDGWVIKKKTKRIIIESCLNSSAPRTLQRVAGQRSVREKEWLEAMKTFGISAEDGKRIIYRLGSLLLSEHEKLFGIY